MAERQSMTTPEVVAKTLIDEHADFLREAVAMVAARADGGRDLAGRSAPARARSPRPGAPTETATGQGPGRPGSARSSWRCRASARARATSRASWSRANEARRRCSAWSWRPTSTGSRPARSTTWSPSSGSTCRRTRSPASAASSTSRSRPSAPGRWRASYPYLWLDAKHLKVRDRGHVHSKALMVAFAVHESGRREVIGIEIAESETEAGWAAFLRELRARGLEGVRLCVSDDHLGLKAAVAKVLGCPWQRCTVHFIRNMHGHCKAGQRNMVSAALREVFNAEDLAGRPGALRVGDRAAHPGRRRRWRSCSTEAEEDLLAFYRFPRCPLAEAALDQQPRAGQQGDRPALGRRRDLPERRARSSASSGPC